ncbi:hypothetical protein BDZ85DRAFT_256405 [Elsinoe ampelina]|uniref:Uncharacterized protein n=1 Tax=Elsinoe ampelina TaxID=302913 RepID=A0A6A6GLN8_9PEZI|nr:hypothetical protein BDZ85DRAFT_256405 [Elsinoe ampelina]
MMSALDGNRTANSFQHQFRAVLKHARELKAQLDGDEVVEGVKAKPRAPKSQKAPKTPKAKAAPKRGRNSDKIKEEDDEDAAVVGEEQDAKRPRYDFDFEDVKQEE